MARTEYLSILSQKEKQNCDMIKVLYRVQGTLRVTLLYYLQRI